MNRKRMHGGKKGLDTSNAYRWWKVPAPLLFIMGLGNSCSCVMFRSHFNWMHWCMANTLNLSNGNWSSRCFCDSHCNHWGLDFCAVCRLHFSKNKKKEQGVSICFDSFQNRPIANKFPWCKNSGSLAGWPQPTGACDSSNFSKATWVLLLSPSSNQLTPRPPPRYPLSWNL